MISFVVGDPTAQRVDAIVNAANEALAPGGGVCGATSELGCRTIAFPALSTGIYGYPPAQAAPIAVSAARELESRFDESRLVFLDDRLRQLFEERA